MLPSALNSLTQKLMPITAGLAEPQAAVARDLVGELAADWLREAGAGADRADILALLLSEHNDASTEMSAEAGFEFLKASVYDRRARRLSVASFTLAKSVIDEAVQQQQGAVEGQALLSQIDALRPLVAGLKNRGTADPVAQSLQAALLDARFASGSKIMSKRLGRYAKTRLR